RARARGQRGGGAPRLHGELLSTDADVDAAVHAQRRPCHRHCHLRRPAAHVSRRVGRCGGSLYQGNELWRSGAVTRFALIQVLTELFMSPLRLAGFFTLALWFLPIGHAAAGGSPSGPKARPIEPWADAKLPVRRGLELWLDASRAWGDKI